MSTYGPPKSSSVSAGVELDKLIHELEYENSQDVREIEKDKQYIEGLGKHLEELEVEVKSEQELTAELDQHIKSYHKQFTQNRQNIESLTPMVDVQGQQEEALAQKLDMLKKKGEEKKAELDGVLQHYNTVWADYKSIYDSFPLAKVLRERQTELEQAEQQLKEADTRKEQLQYQIAEMEKQQAKEYFTDLNSFIVKLAEYKVKSNNQEKNLAASSRENEILKQKIAIEKEKQQEEERRRREEFEAAEEERLQEAKRRALELQEASRKKAMQEHAAIQNAARQQTATVSAQHPHHVASPRPVPASHVNTNLPRATSVSNVPSGLVSMPRLIAAPRSSPVLPEALSRAQRSQHQGASGQPPRLQMPTGSLRRPGPPTGPLTRPQQAQRVIPSNQLQLPRLQNQRPPTGVSTAVPQTVPRQVPQSPTVPQLRPPAQLTNQAAAPVSQMSTLQIQTPETFLQSAQATQHQQHPQQQWQQPQQPTTMTASLKPTTPCELGRSGTNQKLSPNSVKSPKTPKMSPNGSAEEASPFDLDKHHLRLRMLAASSPGSGFTFESRRMYQPGEQEGGEIQETSEGNAVMSFFSSFLGGRPGEPATQGIAQSSTEMTTQQSQQTSARSRASNMFPETLGSKSPDANQPPHSSSALFTLSASAVSSPTQSFTFDLGGGGDATVSTAGPSGGGIFGMFGDAGDAETTGATSPTNDFTFSFGGGGGDATTNEPSQPFSLF